MSKQISCRFVRLFQSTPSLRRATFWKVTATTTPAHFNPRPPHGGRLQPILTSWFYFRYFNPRPPHGGRRTLRALRAGRQVFQSTPSSRRATVNVWHINTIRKISIHALLTEGDISYNAILAHHCIFQSTPSSRRATGKALQFIRQIMISIHALLTEGDFVSSLV